MAAEAFRTRIAAAAELGNRIPGVRYRGLARDWVMAFEADDEVVFLANVGGRYKLMDEADDGAVDVRLAASAEHWERFFVAEPAPGYQTLNAMVMTGVLRLSGETLIYHQYLLSLEMMFGRLPVEPDADESARPAVPVIEPVIGRYLNLSLHSQRHRIYFEEAGEGIPLICLHTAGADGRQYRGLLNDPAVTERFRVIVFDLPRHGKSALSPGFGGDRYLLTTDRYVDFIMAMVDALELVNPVVIGCSIGGRAVLHLALRHGKRFRAAIGLQAALHADSGGADMSGSSISNLFRPDANGSEIGAAWVSAIMAPGSPAEDRWETLWYYMQGGPGVFFGDLHYYFEDGDLRNRITSGAAFDDCPLYLLTGEYDLSATPAMTAELAAIVGARHCQVMQGLGHFPMSENYPVFREYLLPVLEIIEKEEATN